MKKLILLLLLSFSGQQLLACDACGSTMAGIYFGLFDTDQRALFGVRYQYASFSASADYNSDFFERETATDTYQRMELFGRFTISKRLQAQVLLPYMVNQKDGSHLQQTTTGLADAIALLNYSLLNSGSGGIKHSLQVGGGVKLPTGDFQQLDEGQLINPNFQLGSGSTDFLLTTNYTYKNQNWGLNVESAAKLNTANKLDYRFGNQYNTSLYAFRTFITAPVTFVPYAGLFNEWAGGHTADGINQENTGGFASFGTAGVQLQGSKYQLILQYQLPLAQEFNTGAFYTIEANNRLAATLLFNISGSKSKGM